MRADGSWITRRSGRALRPPLPRGGLSCCTLLLALTEFLSQSLFHTLGWQMSQVSPPRKWSAGLTGPWAAGVGSSGRLSRRCTLSARVPAPGWLLASLHLCSVLATSGTVLSVFFQGIGKNNLTEVKG